MIKRSIQPIVERWLFRKKIIIIYGARQVGKTTLATIIAKESERPFYTLSAINSGVKDVRDVVEKAKQSGGLFTAKNPICVTAFDLLMDLHLYVVVLCAHCTKGN